MHVWGQRRGSRWQCAGLTRLGCNDVYERAIGARFRWEGAGERFRRWPAGQDTNSHRRRGGGTDARLQDDGVPVGAQRRAASGSGWAVLPGARQGRPRHAGDFVLRRGLTCLLAARGCAAGLGTGVRRVARQAVTRPPVWCSALPAGSSVRVIVEAGHGSDSGVHGFSNQEAAQAHVEEEAPQAAAPHPGAAQKTWQVTPARLIPAHTARHAAVTSPFPAAVRLFGWIRRAGMVAVRAAPWPTPCITPRLCWLLVHAGFWAAT